MRLQMIRQPVDGLLFVRENLRPYACFEAALTIGIHSDSVPVGSSRTKADGVYCGLGLPEAFSTCGLLIYLCCFCRQGTKEWHDQSDSEDRSDTEHICLLDGYRAQPSRARAEHYPDNCQPDRDNDISGGAKAAMQ